MIDRTNVAALIPCYGEERHIGEVVRRTLGELGRVLVVDDGSPDATAARAGEAGAEVLRHDRNQGKGAAIKTGLRALAEWAPLRYVLTLDGDGQHLPEEIPRFLEAANKTGAGMLLGNRRGDWRSMPFVRQMTNRFMSWQISRLCGQGIPDSQCGFRMYSRELAAAFCRAQSSQYDFETEMLAIAARSGVRIGSVPVSTVYGREVSKIHPVRDAVRFFRLLARLRR